VVDQLPTRLAAAAVLEECPYHLSHLTSSDLMQTDLQWRRAKNNFWRGVDPTPQVQNYVTNDVTTSNQ